MQLSHKDIARDPCACCFIIRHAILRSSQNNIAALWTKYPCLKTSVLRHERQGNAAFSACMHQCGAGACISEGHYALEVVQRHAQYFTFIPKDYNILTI